MENQAQDLPRGISLLSRYYRSEKNRKKRGKRKEFMRKIKNNKRTPQKKKKYILLYRN